MLETVHSYTPLSFVVSRASYAICIGLAFFAVLVLTPSSHAIQNETLPNTIFELPTSIDRLEISNSEAAPTLVRISPPAAAEFPFVGVDQPVRIVSDLRPITRPFKTMTDIVLRSQEISTKNIFGKRLVHVRAQDEVWLVSARNEPDSPLGCQRLIDGQWSNSSVDELATAKISSLVMPTMVYVHGDRTDEQYARSRGLQFYENIFNPGECGNKGPIRFVIFAWKAEREIVRPSSDYRLKLVRSVKIGQTFRALLDRFDDRQILLVGFSLGGQVILSAVSPSDSSGTTCDCSHGRTGRYRIALVTPSLAPKEAGVCLTPLPNLASVKETSVFINRKDRALRAAKVVNRKDRLDAQTTLASLARNCPASAPNQIRVHDITQEVSHCHSITKYSASSILLQSELLRLCDEMRPGAEVEIPTPIQASN